MLSRGSGSGTRPRLSGVGWTEGLLLWGGMAPGARRRQRMRMLLVIKPRMESCRMAQTLRYSWKVLISRFR